MVNFEKKWWIQKEVGNDLWGHSTVHHLPSNYKKNDSEKMLQLYTVRVPFLFSTTPVRWAFLWSIQLVCWPFYNHSRQLKTLQDIQCIPLFHDLTHLVIPPASMKLKEGYIGFASSVHLSICLWTELCPLCNFHNTSQIHFIFTHLIKQLQKMCRL